MADVEAKLEGMADANAKLEAISLRLSSLEDKSDLALFFFSPMQPMQLQPARLRTKLQLEGQQKQSLEGNLEAVDQRLFDLEEKMSRILSFLSSTRSVKSPPVSIRTKLRDEIQKSREGTAAETQVVSEPLLPKGMASASEVTESMRRRQRRNPEQWTMTIQQWCDVLDHCKSMPAYTKLRDEKGRVSMYDVNMLFVIPWSKGTGCGISVLMSKESSEDAKLMVSHSWAEDIEELHESVVDHVAANSIPRSASIWFCAFANYQPQDLVGPSLKEQLELAPLTNVLSSKSIQHVNGGFGVVVIHAAQEDLYTRLWCVHEVDRAMAESDINVTGVISKKLEQKIMQRVAMLQEEGATVEQCLQGVNVVINTSKATCSNSLDEQMLVRLICAQPGGFTALDKVISTFWKNALPVGVFKRLIASDGLKLEDASPSAQADQQTVLTALSTELNSMHYVSKDLLQDPEILSVLAKSCEDKDKHGNAALHIAVQKDNDSCVKVLAQVGADLNVKDSNGSTPLQVAVSQGNDSCVRILAELGADLEVKNHFGETALHIATGNGRESSIRVLAELGVDLEAIDNTRSTALHLAATEGEDACIRILAKLGANLEARKKFGSTALHIAAEKGHESSIRVLAELRADLETKNELGNAPLHIAAREGNDSCIKVLAELGASLDSQDRSGKTPGEIAAEVCTEAAALQAKIVTVALLQALGFTSSGVST